MSEQKKCPYFYIILGLALFGVANIVLVSLVRGQLARNYYNNKELNRPANLEISLIKKSNCDGCRGADGVIDFIKKQNTAVTEKTVDADSEIGKNIIQKYQIKKLPSIIVYGELNHNAELKKFWPNAGEVIEGTFIFREVPLPYWDAVSDKVRGVVDLTLLGDVSCRECYDVTTQKNILANYGLIARTEKLLDAATPEGRRLIQKYGITAAPMVVLEGDLAPYESLTQIWKSVGSVNGGAYVFRESGLKVMGVVYKNLLSGKVIQPIKPQPVSGSGQSEHEHG